MGNYDRAFIFTLKSPHGVEPTRYRKKMENTGTINYDPKYGPQFGNNTPDICISDNCTKKNSFWITKLSNM